MKVGPPRTALLLSLDRGFDRAALQLYNGCQKRILCLRYAPQAGRIDQGRGVRVIVISWPQSAWQLKGVTSQSAVNCRAEGERGAVHVADDGVPQGRAARARDGHLPHYGGRGSPG